jgi:hypothetical protein
MVPTEKKNFKRIAAVKLIKVHLVLMLIHLFYLSVIDVFIYDWEVSTIIGDSILAWLNFYAYMTLNKIICGLIAVFYVLGTLVALTHL